MNKEDKKYLLKLARRAIQKYFQKKEKRDFRHFMEK